MILDVTTQLIRGVAYCHDNCIMHRDLKPANILYFQNGKDYTYKLTDFGLSRSFSRHRDRTYTLNVITRWFRGPEISLGIAKYTESCDVWSVGVILSMLLLKENLSLFASETDEQHFIKLCQVFGFPNGEPWAMSTDKHYRRELKKWETDSNDLRKVFKDNCFVPAFNISPQLKDIIQGMLTMDFTRRITMKVALNILKTV